jgi:hypothetical protein
MVQFLRLYAVHCGNLYKEEFLLKVSQQIQQSFSQGFRSTKINSTLTDKQVSNNRFLVGGEVRGHDMFFH